jgi:hypothetical protein
MLGAELVRRPRGWAHRFRNAQVNLHGPGFTPQGSRACRCSPAMAIIASNGAGPLPMPSLISSAAA